jgi:hypothetical protein
MTTKTITQSVVAVATVAIGLGVASAPAHADVDGRYEVRFEEVANNCTNVGMSLARGQITVKKEKATAITVDIERIPIMSGATGKNGKLKASSKLGATSVSGLDGKFSVAGSVADGKVSLVFVAEYYVKDKSVCTQSWNISDAAKESAEPPKK